MRMENAFLLMCVKDCYASNISRLEALTDIFLVRMVLSLEYLNHFA
jgi:hypothetical protein